MLNHFRLSALIFTLSLTIIIGQSKKEDIWADDNFNGLEFRSIGPALMSGRISDIAIHPEDNNTWYVSVGSGNVWKTENAGITWTPIFDDQGSYSIGCVTIDPNNPNVVWIGTGEDLGGRHFGYGDGVYRSDDGGKTWTNMGYGFTAIIVSWLARLNPWGIVIVANMFAAILVGGDQIQMTMGLPGSVGHVLQGTMLFCVLGGEFFQRYRLAIKT